MPVVDDLLPQVFHAGVGVAEVGDFPPHFFLNILFEWDFRQSWDYAISVMRAFGGRPIRTGPSLAPP